MVEHQPDEQNAPQDNLPVTRRKPRRQLSSTQVMFAAILAIGLMLAINFSIRIEDDRELKAIREAVQQEIELLRKEQANLINELEYVASDAYVEEWARRDGKMVRDGDFLVVPVPSDVVREVPQTGVRQVLMAEAETTLPEPEPWQLWWALFFDDPPPS